MAPLPDTALPAWATWATLGALGLLAALAALVGGVLRRRRNGATDTFWGHVGELRRRLVRMVLAVCGALAVIFLVRVRAAPPFVGVDAYDNLAAQLFRRMAGDLVPADVRLVVTAPTDGFVAVFDVALGLAILLTLPYLLAQVGGFVWPALKPKERRMLVRAVVPATCLFALGALFAYVVLLPAGFGALYTFASVLGAQTFLDVGEFVPFTLMMLGITGLAFQTPLAMAVLARAGLATPRGYLRYWRHAVLAIVIVAALVTPDPTPVSQMLVSGPLVGLYFLGIGLSVPMARRHARDAGSATVAVA